MDNKDNFFQSYFTEAQAFFSAFIHEEKNMDAIPSAANMMIQSIKAGNKIISCGNGGSMTDAMHFAEELSGRFREDRKALPAIAISDPSHITCTANDYGFKFIFSRFVEAVGKPEDVLFAISTSGNSENVCEAARKAREHGMKVVALTGKDGGKLAGLCDAEIRTPYNKYSDHTQELHIQIIHSLILYIEKNLDV